MLGFDRLAIATGYWLYAVHWHRNGRTRRCEATGRTIDVQLNRLRFRPSPLLALDTAETEDVMVYEDLVRRWEWPHMSDAEREAFDRTAYTADDRGV